MLDSWVIPKKNIKARDDNVQAWKAGTSSFPGTYPACLLDRQLFPENLLFGQAKISMKNFQFWFFGDDNQIFS